LLSDPVVFRRFGGHRCCLSSVFIIQRFRSLLSFWLLIGQAWQPWNKLIGGMFLAAFFAWWWAVLAPFSLIG
jgi:hypothetical protein